MDNINRESNEENNLRSKAVNQSPKPISDYNFIKLFFACMHANNQTFFDRNSLRYDLYPFKSDDRYSDLFQNVAVKQAIEGNFLEIEEALQNADFLGIIRLADNINNSKSVILLDDEYSEAIMSCYGDGTIKMDGLVKEFVDKKRMEIPVKKIEY